MTDFGVYDYAALAAGAAAQKSEKDMTTWRSMDSAPRDGSWVELKCTYGVAPWYCVARWTNESTALDCSTGDRISFTAREHSWQKPDGGGPSSESHLHWRPYAGTVENYVDPTGGAQNNMAYWRGAVAAKYGKPIDYFERQTARNISPRASVVHDNSPTSKDTPYLGIALAAMFLAAVGAILLTGA